MKNLKFIIPTAVLVLLAILVFNYNNSMISLQEQIIAKSEDNQQVYSSIRVKIEQAGLVANTYSDQVVRGIEAAIGTRYGGGGAKGAMLWIQEQNPEIKPEVFTKIQQIVDIEFSRFESNQTTLIDLGRIYKTKLRKFPGVIFASILGYSSEDITNYMTVLKTADAKRDFSTGTMTSPDTFGTSSNWVLNYDKLIIYISSYLEKGRRRFFTIMPLFLINKLVFIIIFLYNKKNYTIFFLLCENIKN